MGADRPCAARVEGRESCRRAVWRNSPYCWYHLPRLTGDPDIDRLRWCAWRGDQCQRWALEHSSLCLVHDRASSPIWRRVQLTARIDALSENEARRNQYDEAIELEADLSELAEDSSLSSEERSGIGRLLAASRALQPHLAVAIPTSPLEGEPDEVDAEKRRMRRDQEHWARHRQFRAARLEWDTAVRYLQALGLPEDPGLHDLVSRSEVLNRILSF